MAHARATIGTTNYAVAISAGHHQLNADEAPALGAWPLHRDRTAHVCRTQSLAAARRASGRTSFGHRQGRAIARVLSFDGELNQEQRARLADIAERTPVTLTLKNGLAITTTLGSS